MTSHRKIAANRRNSQRSTGPRTAAGKARVRRNALRHGLAATILKDPTISAEVEQLATLICGKVAEPAKREQALSIAESVIMLSRVRAARLDVIERMSAEGATGSKSRSSQRENPNHSYLTPLLRLGRYERGALLRRDPIFVFSVAGLCSATPRFFKAQYRERIVGVFDGGKANGAMGESWVTA